MLWHVVKKNILLLLRSKSSAFVIIFGPLFIILLIGLAFSSTGTQSLVVGYYTPENSSLTERFITNMEGEGFIVDEFSSSEECIQTIKHGSTQVCLEFPLNFSIEDGNRNEIVFFVDDSRTNFVYQIIESVTANLGVESAELSQDLTNDILNTLWNTEKNIDDAIASLVTFKASALGIADSAQEVSSSASDMDLKEVNVDTDDVEDEFDLLVKLVNDLESGGQEALEEGRDIVGLVNGSTENFVEALDGLEDVLNDSDNDKSNITDRFEDALDAVALELSEVNDRLGDAEDVQQETIESILELKTDIEELRTSLDELKNTLEKAKESIKGLTVTSSETISNPISTKIEKISSEGGNLAYMFPYLVMLVVMFIGILLSGTLIIMEKRSKASFRTFCTPTSEELYMGGNFITSFIVIILQMVVLLGISSYFLGESLLGNISVSILILLLAIIIFILLGMMIGYLLNTQEAVTMVSISVASIFMFLSNLVLPLETISSHLKTISTFNPYVLTSETLRKSLIFGANIHELSSQILTLFGFCAVLLIIIIIFQDLMKTRLQLQLAFKRHNNAFDDPKDLYLRIDGSFIKNTSDLLRWLEHVDDNKFEKSLSWNDIRDWLKKNNKSKQLRVRLAGKDRKGMIKVLQKWLDKHGKKR